MEQEKKSFQYTYSAKERSELEKIRKKYIPQEETPMEQLRRLDSLPGKKARSRSISVGVLGALIMGTGMSLAMTELGNLLGAMAMVLGIAIGVVGLVLVALAYPVYNRVLLKERRRIAPEILRLTDELMK